MSKALVELYDDELRFLLKLKESVGKLNNRIHDKLALIAIEKLRALHPEIKCSYHGAGAGGIDIVGVAEDGTKKLIAEVKTTHTSESVGLRGPQKEALTRDLKRLTDVSGELERYLIVISAQTKTAIERQIRSSAEYPNIKVIDALGLLPSMSFEQDEEE